MEKITTSGIMLGVCYTLSTIGPLVCCTERNRGITGGPHPPPVGRFQGVVVPYTGSRAVPWEFFLGPYIRLADPPMLLCMGFSHSFGHDGFLPMVLCRSGQGNYNYVLIQG